MTTKLLEMHHGFNASCTCKEPLMVLDGVVFRFVFDGAPTLYIYGKAQGSPFLDKDGVMKVLVTDFIDRTERERAALVAARHRGVDISHVRWAQF